jgi:acyl carrier protein
MEDILEIINDICMCDLYVDCDLTMDTNLKDLFDELDIADLLFSIEKEFNIEFIDEEYNEINNVGKLVELIQNKK